MRYLSLFSGCEAATLAWKKLGWTPVGFSEIEPDACAVLAHHYPDVPNLGNVKLITEEQIIVLGHIDLVIFGFPCQDLSIAGKRDGLKGKRSGLFFDAMRVVRWTRARLAMFENVPGLFSSELGEDFAAVVGEMVGIPVDVPKDGWPNSGVFLGPDGLLEYAVLDAQHFGVPQRRRRIFALADFGDWSSRTPILLESESLQGHPAPRREAGEVAPTIPSRSLGCGGLGTDFDCDGGLIESKRRWPVEVAPTLNAHFGDKWGLEDQHALNGAGLFVPDVSHALRADGFDTSEDGTGRGTPLVAVTVAALTTKPYADHESQEDKLIPVAHVDVLPTMQSGTNNPSGHNAISGDCKDQYVVPMAFRACGQEGFIPRPMAPPITATDGGGSGVPTVMTLAVRGRDGVPSLEVREDGIANAVLTPNGGRGGIGVGAVAISANPRGEVRERSVHGSLSATKSGKQFDGVLAPAIGLDEEQNAVVDGFGCLKARREGGGFEGTVMTPAMAVRRLTPVECCRLQGFPDEYFKDVRYRRVLKSGKLSKREYHLADGPIYKMLGNSIAVPCLTWIGQRIEEVLAYGK